MAKGQTHPFFSLLCHPKNGVPSRIYSKCHGNATEGGAQAVFSSMVAIRHMYFPRTLCLVQIEMYAVNVKYSPHFEDLCQQKRQNILKNDFILCIEMKIF